MAAWIKMSLVMELGSGPGDFVLDGHPAPPPQKGGKGGGRTSPNFLAHVYCGQTAGWMKLVLGMVVVFSPGDFVLDGDPSLLFQKGVGAPSPIFSPFLLWPNSWKHRDATWYGCRPQPWGLCVRWRPSSVVIGLFKFKF